MQKRLLIFIFIFTGTLLFNIGCDDNSRSLGNFGIDIATVIPEGENRYSLILDNGKRLWPAASAVNYSPTRNQRVLLNYTILSEEKDGYDHYVKVNDLWEILTKNTIELNTQNKDSIGNDPVKTNAVWIGGDYLNVSFHFNYGGVKPHLINLVDNKTTPAKDTEVIELELRHNSFDSKLERLYEGFACFDLRPFRNNDADSVKISIKVNEWGKDTINTKEKIYDVIYRYNRIKNYQEIAEMPIPVITSSEYY